MYEDEDKDKELLHYHNYVLLSFLLKIARNSDELRSKWVEYIKNDLEMDDKDIPQLEINSGIVLSNCIKRNYVLEIFEDDGTYYSLTKYGHRKTIDYFNKVIIPENTITYNIKAVNLADEANKIAHVSNQKSEDANQLSIESNILAAASNDISKQANRFSKIANKNSKRSNWIAFLAMLISIIAIIVSCTSKS